MLIAAIVVGVIALIAMVILFLEGIIIMLSRNQIRKGLKYVAGAILLGLLAGAMTLYILYLMTPR